MKRSLRFVSVIAIILSAVLLLSGCSEERKQAVANYDRECTRINAERDDLEKVIAEVRNSLIHMRSRMIKQR